MREVGTQSLMKHGRNLKPTQVTPQKPLRVRYSELLQLRRIVREAERATEFVTSDRLGHRLGFANEPSQSPRIRRCSSAQYQVRDISNGVERAFLEVRSSSGTAR
jgi:hypothetical protein